MCYVIDLVGIDSELIQISIICYYWIHDVRDVAYNPMDVIIGLIKMVIRFASNSIMSCPISRV